MKTFCLILILGLCACTNLTRQEQMTLHHLKGQGVTVDRPAGSFEPPASPLAAGAMNFLPGFGNFYLGPAMAVTVPIGFMAA